MAQNKYIVAKIDDVRTTLTPAEQQALHQLLTRVQTDRLVKGKAANQYFVLNLSDPHARAALDAYIQSAVASRGFDENKPLVDVVDVLRTTLSDSRMYTKERNPE